jgi:hypothetical protein
MYVFSLRKERTKFELEHLQGQASRKEKKDARLKRKLQQPQRLHTKKAGKRKETRARPGLGLLQGRQRERRQHKRLRIMNVSVALLLQRPSDQLYKGVKIFPLNFLATSYRTEHHHAARF